jgi:ABC-type antimicrobial peptide transport system permease subunit
VRRQVGATLAVQATAITAVGLVVGLPLGIAGGRTIWGMVATGLSVVRRPVVPPSVLLIPPVALALALVMALLPARRAAGIRPAEVFRSE